MRCMGRRGRGDIKEIHGGEEGNLKKEKCTQGDVSEQY